MLALFDVDNPWLVALGRLHPLVLHLPIGLFAGIALLEFGALLLKKPVPRAAVATLSVFAAVMAAVTASSGWVLGDEKVGEFDAQILASHKALGVATAVVALLAAMVAGLRLRAPFRWLLVVTLGFMAAAGHLGASLTHGSEFLFEPFHAKPVRPATPHTVPDVRPTEGTPLDPAAKTPEVPPSEPATPPAAPEPPVENAISTYVAVIAPILERTCVNCHNPQKHKGGLVLSSRAGIEAGGENEAALVPGKPEASAMYTRLLLPLDDDDHMPKRGKPQPTAEEIESLRQWIAAGAPFEGVIPLSAPRPDVPPAPKPKAGTPPEEPVRKTAAAPAAPAAIDALRRALAHVAPIALDSELLRVDFAAIAPQVDDDKAAALLTPLAAQIAELSLARTAISDAALAQLAAMPNLRDLDLRGTAVTSVGVAALRPAAKLERLVLAQTHLDDSATASLAAMPALREVYLWQSGVSEAAVAQLCQRAPSLQVDAGVDGAAAALEVEPEVELGKVTAPAEAPAAAATEAPGKASTAALTPVNSVCPVSGKPVDPHYLVVHDGKVIGFCCPNCPQAFWQDPAKYPVAAK